MSLHRDPRPDSGFSFLEVLMALSMLLVGSVAILSLFAIGAQHMVQRKIDARLTQVRPEVQVIVQQALDGKKPGEAPEKITDLELPQRDFSLDVEFQPSPFGGDRYVALAVISFRGSPVRVLLPSSSPDRPWILGDHRVGDTMSTSKTLFAACAALAVVVTLAGPAGADVVHLRTGQAVKGRPIQERSNENVLTIEDYLTGALRRFDWDAVDPADRERLQGGWGWTNNEGQLIEGSRIVLRLSGGEEEEIFGVVESETDAEVKLRRQGDLLTIQKAQIVSNEPESLDVRQVYDADQLYERLAARMKEEGVDFGALTGRDHWRLATWAEWAGALEQAKVHYTAAAADEEFLKRELANQRLARVDALIQDEAARQTLRTARIKLQQHLFRRVREILDGFGEQHPDAGEAVLGQLEAMKADATNERSAYFTNVAKREYVDIVEDLIQDKVREEVDGEPIALTDVTSWTRRDLPEAAFARMAEKYMSRYDDVTPEEARAFWDRRLELRSKPRWRRSSYGSGTFIVDPPKIKPPKRNSGGGGGARRPGSGGGGSVQIPKPPTRDQWWDKANVKDKTQWVLAYFAERSELFELGDREFRPCQLCHGVGLLSKTLQTGDTLSYLCTRCGGAQQDVVVKYR